MSRCSGLLWGALAALLPLLACTKPGERPPDVILISIDSVRADFLTFLDEDSAPNLTRLARRGAIFTQALSGTSWTLPAHLQMFTGLPPVLHGVQESDQRLDPKIATLPRLLKNAGYRTAGFYTCWYLAPDYGFGDGFDLYRNSMRGGEHLDQALKAALGGDESLAQRRKDFKNSMPSEKYINSQVIVGNARQALAEMGQEDPVFLFTHFFDPHFDYIPPKPWDTAFDPDYQGTMTGKQYWTNKLIFDQGKQPARQINERNLDHIRALYRGEIAWVDAAIGELLADLEERGNMDNTLIIVTADHGEEFFEHGGRGHRQNLYDEVLRVPLLVIPPHSTRASAIQRSEQVGLSDILPTVLEYAGVTCAQPFYGRSLRPLVEGQNQPARPQISSLALPLSDPERGRGRALIECLRTATHKLTRSWTQFEGQGEPTLFGLEYFDLVQDPMEQNAISSLDDKRARQAWRQLENAMAPIREAWKTRAKTAVSDLFTELESLVGEDLAGLGYVRGAHAQEITNKERNKRLGLAPLAPARLSARAK